ncbi:hypothetical protein MACH09_15260 [Vibrio sp. MACH09]|uniref:hypothetical protein n=1 Tax=unclassified Vibrio TaxID=2614977 RepID=UPI001C1158BC|nr:MULTISPECIES: hypothetical protein [unclassified Vibrio]GLO61018.1 hypothetical protein MACH09_15260 [Vibrio sp. MACH09]
MITFYRNFLLLWSLLLSFSSNAADESLYLVYDEKVIAIPLASLRLQSTTELEIFSPFRNKEITVHGVFLESLIKQYLLINPQSIKLVAVDNYSVTMNNWQERHWLLVTKEDGKPITLRQHGPIRLIEVEYGDRDPANLRNFNDWIWMIKRIEVIK